MQSFIPVEDVFPNVSRAMAALLDPQGIRSASITAAVVNSQAPARATANSLGVSYSRTDEREPLDYGVTKDFSLTRSLQLRGPLVSFAFSLFFCGSAGSLAQEPLFEKKGDPGVLKGIVLNSITHVPVSRALVHSLDSRLATLTDDQGRFEFRVPRAGNQSGGSASAEPAPVAIGASSLGAPASQVAEQSASQVAAISSQLRARKPGYLTDTNAPEFVASDDEGETLTIALVPEALLTGRVNLPSEATVDRSQVQLYRREVQEGRGGWTQAGVAATDSEGEFRFADLPAGEYKVFTSEILDRDQVMFDPRAQLYGFPPVYYPNASDFDSAGVVHLAAGTAASANLTPVRREYYPVRIGVANGSRGNGHNVLVFPQGHGGPGYSLAYNEREQLIEGLLPNGAYTLEVLSFGQGGATGQMNFSVRGGPFVGRSISLLPNSSVSVIVKHEFESGDSPAAAVETLSDQPQGPRNTASGRDVQVTLIPLEEFGGREPTSPVRPSNGIGDQPLVFENLKPGRYRVRVEAVKGYAATVSSGGTDLLRQPLVLSPGVATSPIDVTVRDDGAHVQGEIEHWAEEARAHGSGFNAPGHLSACVYLVPRSGSAGQFRVAWVNDGKFELSQVPPGEYEVLAFDRPPLDLEYESSEAMQKYEGKWQGLHLGPGAKENLKVPLIRTDE